MSTPLYYAGIGSRETPEDQLTLMTNIAAALERMGWILRSGGAKGADDAFEQGVVQKSHQEIFVPWNGFNGRRGSSVVQLAHVSRPLAQAAMTMASNFHPAWGSCSSGAQQLLARNTMQVLGQDLNTPVRCVVFWAPGVRWDQEGRICDVKGGTGLAVRLAHYLHIPVIHTQDLAHKVVVQAMLDGDGPGLSQLLADMEMAQQTPEALRGLRESLGLDSVNELPSPDVLVRPSAPTGRWKRGLPGQS